MALLLALLPAVRSAAVQAAPAARLAPGQTIKVCGQVAEWPPYLYFARRDGQKTTELTGYTLEYLQRSLSAQGLHYKIDMIPWRRCIESVDRGIYDMAVDISNNPERAQRFLVSLPYYTLQLVYFYDKDRPKPQVRTVADLKKYRLCAVNGYNYAGFGLKPEEIETGSQNMTQSFQKLKHDRCDAMPERLEVVYGYKAIGVVDIDQLNIGVGRLPDLPLSDFHMMVSRNVAYGPELLTVLNEGIEKIQNGPAAREIAAKYAIPGVDLRRK